MQLSCNRFVLHLACAAVALSATAIVLPAQGPDGGLKYRVSITNITKGQIISPVVVATHSAEADPLWELGAAASEELAQIAEDAVLDPMISRLSNAAEVLDVRTIAGEGGGPIMPGETASIEIDVTGDFRLISAAGMLVTTNDAFTGLDAVEGPNQGTQGYLAPAYDSGSEANTELCEHIPGPPCENAGVRVTEGAEGYVHIHSGISGDAAESAEEGSPSVPEAEFDWRNPVAKFAIERL